MKIDYWSCSEKFTTPYFHKNICEFFGIVLSCNILMEIILSTVIEANQLHTDNDFATTIKIRYQDYFDACRNFDDKHDCLRKNFHQDLNLILEIPLKTTDESDVYDEGIIKHSFCEVVSSQNEIYTLQFSIDAIKAILADSQLFNI